MRCSRLSRALVRAERLTLCLALLGLAAYGYGPEQDPFVQSIKQLAADANAGRWPQAERSYRGLEPSLAEIRTTLGVDPAPALERALAGRAAERLARELALAAYLGIELKLESCRREELRSFYAAKYRVEAARGYYMELLSLAVRRSSSGGEALHASVFSAFDAARASLGRPGLLGRGVVPPDPAAFDAARGSIRASLVRALPFLGEVSP